jgi:hypothetical protein
VPSGRLSAFVPLTPSTLPARSTARTWSTCSVAVAELLTVTTCGDEHGVHTGSPADIAPSSLHWNLTSSTGVWLSLPVNLKVAVVRTVTGSGPEVILVSGGVTSGGGGWIHHECHADVTSLLPARSTARTSKM